MSQPPTPANEAASAELRARAWRLLLTAAAARGARVEHPDSPWLVAEAGGYAAAPAAPAAVRPLLDLYGPLCSSGARQSLTIAHLGQSLDGHIATASGDSYYVTGPDNVEHLHRLRALCGAVVVGAGTVERDDPQLTVRHVEGPQPVRVILDSAAKLPGERRVFTDHAAPTVVVHGEGVRAKHAVAAEVLVVPCDGGLLRLDLLVAKLHERGLTSVFVEGGGATVSHFLAANLLDRLHVAIAPLVTGRGRPGLTLPARDAIADCLRPQHRVYRMGDDVLFDCDLRAAIATAAPGRGTLTRVI
jgi:riboflavin-specific deaminase-like protein